MAKREPYSEEVKRTVMARLVAPDAPSVLALAKELGISEPTLYAWRKEARGGIPTLSAEAHHDQEEIAALRRRIDDLEEQLDEKNEALAKLSLKFLKQQGVL